MKALLQKTRFAVLDMEDAPHLSRWFGAREDRVARALGRTGIGTGAESYEFWGLILTRSTFINRSQPRICPACLAESGICAAAWEVSANVACSRHGALLISGCPGCAGAVRWDRPHLFQCSCGWSLLMATAEACSDEERDVAGWMEGHLGLAPRHQCTTSLGRLLSPLGLDAGLHALGALGTVRDQNSDSTPTDFSKRKRNSTVKARQSIERACSVLEQVNMGAGLPHKLKMPLAARQLLAEATASAYSPAERQLALSLLAALGRLGSKSRWSGRNPQLSQLELF